MSYQAGDKVQYFYKNKWRDGVIHGVRKAEAVKGPEITLGYLVDTGKVIGEVAVTDGKNTAEDLKPGKKAHKVEMQPQPEQVEVAPDEVRDREK